MKKIMCVFVSSLIFMMLCSCNDKLINMGKSDNGKYTSILWNDRTYTPFCVVSKGDCGKKIGCIDSNKYDIVSLYKDLSPEEWIANYLTMDGGAMLYKEINVTDIPYGLEREYET
ncbi:MAG: hypothetical protein K2G14_06095 [Ruminococcus sp.]|nr:hypothetical protein [Ruminococcus sp.]